MESVTKDDFTDFDRCERCGKHEDSGEYGKLKERIERYPNGEIITKLLCFNCFCLENDL